MTKTVDSYHFLRGINRRVVTSWIKLEEPRPIPWTPLSRPTADCTVALISSGGIAKKTDLPFDQEGEQEDPWWGDPSYRVLPRTTTTEEIRVYHLHIEPGFAEQDLNCLLPLQPLIELEAVGEIKQAAPSHYSFMGYCLDPRKLLEDSTPAMIRRMREEGVEIVVLIPA
jgi:D-proline reductase (dithiol) PrdB